MSSHIGPVERNPDKDELNYAYLVGAATYVLSEGAATLVSVQTGVAGGAGALANIYDARTGDTLNADSMVGKVLLTSATAIRFGRGGLALGRGLTIVLDSGATVECTVSFLHAATNKSTRTFGA